MANSCLGLNLLKDPDKVMEPETACALMSHGMRTGQGFANGHKLAEKFEDLLYDCRDLS
jgi:hypothetical protein